MFIKKKIILLLLISIEVTIIFFLFFQAFLKPQSILGTYVTNPITEQDISKNNISKLKYFYEPKSNDSQKINSWAKQDAQYTINSDTLHDSKEYSLEKPENTIRIITLGDSFTFGLYVDTNENWTELLEAKLNGKTCNKSFEVINLGVFGYDIQDSVERYKLRGKKYDPDLIIWFIKYDDIRVINELMKEREEYYREKFRNSGQNDKLKVKSDGYEPWQLAVDDIEKQLGKDKILTLQKEYLKQINDYFNKNLLIVSFSNILPEHKRFLMEFVQSRPNTRLFDGIPDLQSEIGLEFPEVGHPTQKGHEMIASKITNFLENSNLYTCN